MWVADYSHHGGKNDILSVRTRNNPWLVAPVVIQHPNDENPNDNLTDHKHDNHGDDKAEYWQNPDVADLTNSDFIDVAEVTADQHDHPMSISTPVSSCHCCPGPGVDNVGPLPWRPLTSRLWQRKARTTPLTTPRRRPSGSRR